MININSQRENLQNAVASLNAKVEELNASVLVTGDDAIASLRDKLKNAVDALSRDIQNLQAEATNANNNKKW